MRSNGFGIALCAGAAVFMLATGAFAQPAPEPAPAPAPPAEPSPVATPPASTPAATVTFGSGGATTSTGDTVKDEASKKDDGKKDTKPGKLPWRGTQLIWDNSTTTQSVGIGDDYNADNPVYEMSWSFRPRYYLIDADPHTLNVNMRFEVVQEYTNSDSTTKQREAQFGNIWLNLAYGYTIYKNPEKGWLTSLSVGPRVIFPTDKYTYNNGTRLQLGGSLGLNQGMPLAGPEATWFPTAGLNLSGAYQYNIMNSITGENTDFTRERQDVNGQTILSNQIGSGAKVAHQFTGTVGASIDVTEKLHTSASYIWILQWTHKFDRNDQVSTLTGPVQPDRLEDSVNYRVLPYVLAGVDYDLLPEVGLGVGYYNVTNQIGPEGTRRNPLWSPDARVFFDVTANLDEIYNTLSGRRAAMENSAAKANARQAARLSTLQYGL